MNLNQKNQMKTRTKISAVLLLFGLVTFGQDLKNSNLTNIDLASNQNKVELETKPYLNLNVSDSIKVKGKRDVPWFVERFKIAAGFYEAVNNTNIQVGNNAGSIGSAIDFENDLGFDKKSSSFFSDIQWRATSRSRFVLSYYNLRRNSNYTLRKSFEFGDHTYTVNADIYAHFNTEIYRFSYGYALISKPKYEIGLLIGTHIVGANAGLSLQSNIINSQINDDFGFTAPLPDFGIWGGYAFTNRLAFNGEFDYFAIQIKNINGKILGYNFELTYKALQNLNLTAGLSDLNFKIDANNDNLNGHFRWGNNGFSLKATYTFGHKNWL